METMIPIKPMAREETGRKAPRTDDGASRTDLPDFMAVLFQSLDPRQTILPVSHGERRETANTANTAERAETAEGGDPKARMAPRFSGDLPKPADPMAAVTRTLPAASGVGVPSVDRESIEEGPVLPAEQPSAEDLGNLHPGMGKSSGEIPVPFHPPGGEAGNSGRPPFPEPGSPSNSMTSSVSAPSSGSPEGGMKGSEVQASERPAVRIDPQNLMEQVGGRILPVIRTGGGAGEHVMKIQLEPASLGRLEVRISVTDKQVATAIVTESEAVRDLIQSHQHLLRTALVEQGFAVADLRVDVGDQPQGGERQGSFESQWSEAEREEGSGRENDSGEPGRWRDPPSRRRFAAGEADRLVSIFA